MSGEIERAVERYEARKTAIYAGGDRESLDQDRMRTLLVGLDIDLDELNDFRHAVVEASLEVFSRALDEGLNAHMALAHTLAGTWVDGIVTGILMEQDRKEGTP